MKKYLAIFTIMIAIAFTACAGGKKVKQNKNGKAAKGREITRISMSRGACFGRCPIYTVEISKNGLARYEGRNFTEFKGGYEKQFSPAQVAVLFTAFEKYSVDTCSDTYNVTIADLPGLSFTLMIDKKEKTIGNAGFGPQFLTELGQLVDKTVKADNTWHKVSEPKEIE